MIHKLPSAGGASALSLILALSCGGRALAQTSPKMKDAGVALVSYRDLENRGNCS